MSPEIVRGPLSPPEAAERRTEQIPEEVFNVFNGLITQNLVDGRSKVLQKDVIAQLEERGFVRQEIFTKHLLDVEDSYRKVGWEVVYDRPAYWGGENFEAYFKFCAQRSR